MPLLRHGPLKGFYSPDYDGGSVLNLLASVIRGRGGRSPHPPLRGLPAAAITPYKKVVLLLVDGVGELQLQHYLEAGRGPLFWGRHPHRVISTVCPATTAAAVTTFGTGASPAEHGILGWHLHLPDLGMVCTILPSITRTDAPMASPEFNLGRYLKLPAPVATTKGRRALLSWGHIPTSRYSRAGNFWTVRRAFQTLPGLVRQTVAFARAPGRGWAYVYWPRYDSYCHEKGVESRKARHHLDELDKQLAALVRRLAGTGTLLLVTADHGLVDVMPGRGICLRDVPGFYDCLAMLPSGDARQTQCFVRPGRVAAFKNICRTLAPACVVVPGREVLAWGLYGPGRPHPALANRVGDFVLFARDGYAFTSPPAGDKDASVNTANHGGLSAAEMRVPLFVVNPDELEG